MRIGNFVRRRVWVGTICVLAVTGAWWLSVRSKQEVAAVAAKPKDSFVKLAGAGTTAVDRELQERAEYFDPTPLFFPTEHNFGQNQPPESARREPGQVFESFEPKLNYAEKITLIFLGFSVTLVIRSIRSLGAITHVSLKDFSDEDSPVKIISRLDLPSGCQLPCLSVLCVR